MRNLGKEKGKTLYLLLYFSLSMFLCRLKYVYSLISVIVDLSQPILKWKESTSEIYIPEKYTCKYTHVYMSMPCAQSVCIPNQHRPPPRWPTLVLVFVMVFAPSWASACLRLQVICEDTIILNSAAASLVPNIMLAEWVLLVRCHLPELPLLHQSDRLAVSASSIWFLIFWFLVFGFWLEADHRPAH